MPKTGWLKLTKSDPTLNWFEKLERRGSVVIFTTLFVVAAIIAATCLRISWAYDVYWHLQAGKDWVENGLSPWVDHHSFTFEGAEIRSPAALFQAGIYYLVDWLGLETAFKFYKFFALTLTLCLSALWLRMIRAPVVAYVLVLPLIGLLLQLRAIERPELVGFALLVAGLMLYERARTRDELSARTMVPILALMVFWTNYHGAILGYVLFFGLFFDFALKRLESRASLRSWIKWAGWGAVVVAAGFLKPNFSHPAIEMLAFSDKWKDVIIEYRAPVNLLRVPGIYAVMALALVTFWMLVRQRKFGYLLVCLVFLYNALTVSRMVAPAGILVLCLFALVLRDARPEFHLQTATRRWQRVAAAAVWTILLVSVWTSVSTAREFIKSNLELTSRYPSNMIAYMRDNGFRGRVFNEYQIGGYLIWGMDGDLKVFIDGRTAILYPFDHYLRYEAALKSAAALRREIEDNDVEFAVFSNRPEFARLATDTGALGLEYVDDLYALYRRDDPALPVLGYLWGSPACWSEALSGAIATEHVRALLSHPPSSPLLAFADLVARYTAAEGEVSREEVLATATLDEVVGRRFVAYRALAHENFALAANAIEGLQQKDPRDLLAGAWAHLELGDFVVAEDYLDMVTRLKLDEVHANEVVVLYTLLKALQDAGKLSRFESDYIEELRQQVDIIAPEARSGEVSVDLLCTGEPPPGHGA